MKKENNWFTTDNMKNRFGHYLGTDLGQEHGGKIPTVYFEDLGQRVSNLLLAANNTIVDTIPENSQSTSKLLSVKMGIDGSTYILEEHATTGLVAWERLEMGIGDRSWEVAQIKTEFNASYFKSTGRYYEWGDVIRKIHINRDRNDFLHVNTFSLVKKSPEQMVVWADKVLGYAERQLSRRGCL